MCDDLFKVLDTIESSKDNTINILNLFINSDKDWYKETFLYYVNALKDINEFTNCKTIFPNLDEETLSLIKHIKCYNVIDKINVNYILFNPTYFDLEENISNVFEDDPDFKQDDINNSVEENDPDFKQDDINNSVEENDLIDMSSNIDNNIVSINEKLSLFTLNDSTTLSNEDDPHINLIDDPTTLSNEDDPTTLSNDSTTINTLEDNDVVILKILDSTTCNGPVNFLDKSWLKLARNYVVQKDDRFVSYHKSIESPIPIKKKKEKVLSLKSKELKRKKKALYLTKLTTITEKDTIFSCDGSIILKILNTNDNTSALVNYILNKNNFIRQYAKKQSTKKTLSITMWRYDNLEVNSSKKKRALHLLNQENIKNTNTTNKKSRVINFEIDKEKLISNIRLSFPNSITICLANMTYIYLNKLIISTALEHNGKKFNSIKEKVLYIFDLYENFFGVPVCNSHVNNITFNISYRCPNPGIIYNPLIYKFKDSKISFSKFFINIKYIDSFETLENCKEELKLYTSKYRSFIQYYGVSNSSSSLFLDDVIIENIIDYNPKQLLSVYDFD